MCKHDHCSLRLPLSWGCWHGCHNSLNSTFGHVNSRPCSLASAGAGGRFVSSIYLLICNLTLLQQSCFTVAVYLSSMGESTAGTPSQSSALFCRCPFSALGEPTCWHRWWNCLSPCLCVMYLLPDLSPLNLSVQKHYLKCVFQGFVVYSEDVRTVEKCVWCFCVCDTGFHIAQAGLELSAVLDSDWSPVCNSKHWDCRSALPHWFMWC